ncbi:response regulator [Enterobacter cloacae]|uniref:hybrid sensor histidine kinase/response regulator n=1 Tax=Enterobacter cloacae TaxID=550 RepID=UPI0034A52CBC
MINTHPRNILPPRKNLFTGTLLALIFLTTVTTISSQSTNNYLTTKKENLILAREFAEIRLTQLSSYLNMLAILYKNTDNHKNSTSEQNKTQVTRFYNILSPGNNKPESINKSLEILSYLSSTFADGTIKNKPIADNFLLAVKEDYLAWHSSDQSDIIKVMTDDNARKLIKSLNEASYNNTRKYNIDLIKNNGVFWVPLHDEAISGKHVVYSIAPVLVNKQVTHIIGIRFQSIDIPYYFINPNKPREEFIISKNGGTAFGLDGDIYTKHEKKTILAILKSKKWKAHKSDNMQPHFVWPYIFISTKIKNSHWSIVITFSIREIFSRLIQQYGFLFALSGLLLFLIWISVIYISSRPQYRKSPSQVNKHSKDFFIAGIAHEIRTPLHGALGNLELLRNEVKSPVAVARINVINDTMSSLMMLTDSILNQAKMKKDEFTQFHEPYNVVDLLEQCLHTWAPLITRKKVALYFLPNEILDLHIYGDSQRLKQIVLNLLSNAHKFTVHGAIILQTRRTVNAKGQKRLQISISDTGCGIPEDKQKVVFQPFIQNVAEHPQYTEGTGLGLALCQQIARQMDGEIFLESEIDVGSRFTLDIPLENALIRPDVPDTQLADLPVTLYCSSPLWQASLTSTLSHWGILVTHHDIDAQPSLYHSDNIALIASTELPSLSSLASTGSAIILLTPDGPLAPETSGKFTSLTAFSTASLRALLQQRFAPEDKIPVREEITPPPLLPTPKLLAVDDNPVNLALIHEQLRTIGYSNIDLASSGEKALKKLQFNDYALIITDFHMPILSGEDLVLWLRQHGVKTPVIATSAATVSSPQFDAILLKPISLEQLRTTLNRFLPQFDSAPSYSADKFCMDAHRLFSSVWPVERERILSSIAKGDKQDFSRLMHRLKGSLLTLGWCEHAEFTDILCQNLPMLTHKSWENCWLMFSTSIEHMIKYIR